MEVNMNYKKILIVAFILLVILSVGAVSASEDTDALAQDSDVIISQDSAIDDNNLAAANDDIILSNSTDEQENNPFFSTSPGPVDPDEESGIGLVLQYETDGTIEVVNLNKTSTIIENLNISNINPIYIDEGMEYRIPSEEFNFNELADGDVLSFRFQGDDGSSCENFFTFVDNQDGTIHFDSFGPYFVINDVSDDDNPVIATLLIPASPLNGISPFFTGEIGVVSRSGFHCRIQVTEDNATVIPIYKSDIDNFDSFNDGSRVVFQFVDDDGSLLTSEICIFKKNKEGTLYLDIFDEPYFVISEIINADNPVVATLMIPSIPGDGSPSFTGKIGVWSRNGNHYRQQITEDNSTVIPIDKSEIDNFYLFEDGSKIVFDFVDDDGGLIISETRVFTYDEDGNIILEEESDDGNDFIINLISVNVLDNDVILRISHDQIPVDVDDGFTILVMVNGEKRETAWSISNLTLGVNGYEWTTDELFINELMETVYPFYDLDVHVQCYRDGEEAEHSTGIVRVYNTPFIINGELSLINDERVIAFAFFPGDVHDEFNVEIWKNGSLYSKKDFKISEMDQYQDDDEYRGYYIRISDLGINESGEYNATLRFIKGLGEDVEYICYAGEFSVVSFPIEFYVQEGKVVEEMAEPLCRIDLPEDCEGNVTVKVDGNKVFESTLEEIIYDGYDGIGYYIPLNSLNITESGDYTVEVTVETADWGTRTAEETISFNVTENIFDFRDSIYGEFILDIHIGTAISRDSEIILYLNGNKAATGRMDNDLYFEFNENFTDIYGSLKPGVYEAMLEIDGKNVAEDIFEVKDTSGNVDISVTNDNSKVYVIFKAPMPPQDDLGGYSLDIYVDSADPFYLHGGDEPSISFMYDELEELLDNNVHAIELDELEPGEHIVFVVYRTYWDYPLDEQDFFVRIYNITVNIEPVESILTVTNVSTTYKSGKDIVATLTDADGNPIEGASVGFAYNGVNYVNTDANGQARYSTDNFDAGTYDVKVAFFGNDYYKASEYMISKVNISKVATRLSVNSVSTTYKSGKNIVATLTDVDGNPIEGVGVGFANNGVKYVNTDANGKARYSTDNFEEGTYNVKVAFFGDNNYYASEKMTAKVTISKIPTRLSVNVDTTKSGKDIVATLTDANGNPVSGVGVGFANNGVKYVNTDANGQARYSTKGLAEGTYNVKVAFFGDNAYKASDKVTVKVTISKIATRLSVPSVSTTYKSGKDLVATLTDVNGKPIEGVSVGFAYNGVKYVNTDANGKARYSTDNFAEGTYNVKVAFFGDDTYNPSDKVTAKVTIGKIATKLTSSNVNVGYKADDYLVATLKDANGDPVSGVSIGFANNGVTYCDTDANGQAKYSTKGLAEGTYNVKVAFFGNDKYRSSERVSVTIVVSKIATKLTASDVVHVRPGEDTYLVATLTDANGKPIEGASVGFANNGVTYLNTDANGQAKYSTKNLAQGTYNIKMAYYGNDTYSRSNQVSTKLYVSDYYIPSLVSSGVTTTYGANDYLVVTLIGMHQQPVSGAQIEFAVNGKHIIGVTDSEGHAKISTKGYSYGSYKVVFKYAGDLRYGNMTSSAKMVIKRA